MADSDRDTHKYYYKLGNKIKHAGITNDLERRESEHSQKWPGGHICQVGRCTTRDAALEWEEEQKSIPGRCEGPEVTCGMAQSHN